jgi:hypothetical protein
MFPRNGMPNDAGWAMCTERLRLGAWVIAVACATGAAAQEPGRIQPYRENPRYWEYQGRPILLLGGTEDDNLFQIPNLKQHLDELAEAGGNYIRNTMSDRRDRGFEVSAFAERGDGKYDLEGWNPEYWSRFENMLKWTKERGIIVQIELWDRFDHAQKNWEADPFNPKNNVNYTYEESGFAAHYPDHAGSNKQPFFFTTPGQRNNEVVFKYQQKFIDEVLRRSLPYPNVLYCMDNETSGDAAWGRFWAEHVKGRASAAGVEVQVTEMWDDWNLAAPVHRQTWEHPELYTFLESSQNNHQKGQLHWDRFQWLRNAIGSRPRPINTVKTYGADGGRYGSTRDGIERWWRHLIGGAAAVRFHRPDSGLGLSEPAQASIRAARKLESVVRFWEATPAQELLGERDENEAYATAKPGKAYAVFFPDGGDVALDLSGQGGTYECRWIDIGSGAWGKTETRSGGSPAALRAPGAGPWAVAVKRIDP